MFEKFKYELLKNSGEFVFGILYRGNGGVSDTINGECTIYQKCWKDLFGPEPQSSDGGFSEFLLLLDNSLDYEIKSIRNYVGIVTIQKIEEENADCENARWFKV